jgi:orotate phosphoribosyltransferase-like protein
MSRHQFSDEQIDRVFELKDQGLTYEVIGQRLGVSRGSVASIVRRYGPTVIDLTDMTPEDAEERMQAAVDKVMGERHER